MLRRALVALALVAGATAVLPAGAQTTERVGTHTLVVTVKKTMAPAAEKRLAVLVLISQDDAAPAGALATPGKPLTVLQRSRGPYRIKAEIDSTCRGGCSAPTYRISGSANHRLEIVPSCRPAGAGFVCSNVRIVKVG